MEDIIKSDWAWLCESFTRQHRGWPGIVCEPGIPLPGPGAVAREQLKSLRLDTAGDTVELIIELTGKGGGTRTCRAPRVAGIRLQSDGDGAHRALHVTSETGETLMLYLPVSLPMEMLDGVDPAETKLGGS